ncbi:tyrosine-type recombinase/integrase [Streptomonospora wellingtoniae]|uniref:Site-specific integrase n=1 Tax=Streptomonospora wellingtoniae TaxID=3075544 RepID=A0ABU2L0P5_9ACTN|nr:site-specific integrase [Streptomonospora sp. DSM 45055]MDT0305100.1 site-specific integrase [Streptomonospora sp. DSM 45055]
MKRGRREATAAAPEGYTPRKELYMPYIRRLPSGLWQATVRGADGKKHTRTDPLKKTVQQWAREQETARDQQVWQDPRAGHLTLGQWHPVWLDMRTVEAMTAAQDTSTWRVHVEPKWAGWKLAAIDVEAVRTWRAQMEKSGVGPHAQIKALNYLSAMLSAAVPKRISHNPVHEVGRPKTPTRTPFYWSTEERSAILAAADPRYRTALDLDLHVGLRPGELMGLPTTDVDWPRGLLHVTQVWTRKGIKRYPKSKKSHRTVPIPPHLMDPLQEILNGAAISDATPVFPAPGGSWLDDRHFQHRIMDPALAAARLCGHPPAAAEETHGECREEGCGYVRHRVRRGTPNDMRHTAASQLVISGVDLYRVQELLGHESYQTTQRYAHLSPNRFDPVVEAWRSLSCATDAPESGITQRHPETPGDKNSR